MMSYTKVVALLLSSFCLIECICKTELKVNGRDQKPATNHICLTVTLQGFTVVFLLAELKCGSFVEMFCLPGHFYGCVAFAVTAMMQLSNIFAK